jgi:hypothetical protein
MISRDPDNSKMETCFDGFPSTSLKRTFKTDLTINPTKLILKQILLFLGNLYLPSFSTSDSCASFIKQTNKTAPRSILYKFNLCFLFTIIIIVDLINNVYFNML